MSALRRGIPRRKEKAVKNALGRLLLALLFLAGLALLLYPLISDLWNQRRSEALIRNYTQQFTQGPQRDYSEWFRRADAYNAALAGKGVPDAFALISPDEDADYLSQLSLSGDGVMAYIRIPRISVDLPIFHGTSAQVLERGVGHLQGSALPVGGADTHCVLSAHRGLPSAALFTDLDMLQPGDHFYIYVLDRVLAYEVDQILTVEPDHTQDLDVVPGEDLVTLVTCTPYGVNTHRLLVRGHRVEYVRQAQEDEARNTVSSVHTRYGLWVAVGLGATAGIILLLLLLRRVTARRDGKPPVPPHTEPHREGSALQNEEDPPKT